MVKKALITKAARPWLIGLGALGLFGFLRGRSRGSRILILGDSQSQTHSARKVPTPETRAYTLGPRLAESLRAQGHTVEVVGIAGRGVRSYLGDSGPFGLKSLLTRYNPEVLVVALGGNDATFLTPRGGSMSESFYEQRLREFVRIARAAGVRKIVWLGPSHSDDPAYNALRQKIATVQRRTLGALGVPWFDQQDTTRPLSRRDGLHHTPESYAIWATKVLPQVQRALA